MERLIRVHTLALEYKRECLAGTVLMNAVVTGEEVVLLFLRLGLFGRIFLLAVPALHMERNVNQFLLVGKLNADRMIAECQRLKVIRMERQLQAAGLRLIVNVGNPVAVDRNSCEIRERLGIIFQTFHGDRLNRGITLVERDVVAAEQIVVGLRLIDRLINGLIDRLVNGLRGLGLKHRLIGNVTGHVWKLSGCVERNLSGLFALFRTYGRVLFPSLELVVLVLGNRIRVVVVYRALACDHLDDLRIEALNAEGHRVQLLIDCVIHLVTGHRCKLLTVLVDRELGLGGVQLPTDPADDRVRLIERFLDLLAVVLRNDPVIRRLKHIKLFLALALAVVPGNRVRLAGLVQRHRIIAVESNGVVGQELIVLINPCDSLDPCGIVDLPGSIVARKLVLLADCRLAEVYRVVRSEILNTFLKCFFAIDIIDTVNGQRRARKIVLIARVCVISQRLLAADRSDRGCGDRRHRTEAVVFFIDLYVIVQRLIVNHTVRKLDLVIAVERIRRCIIKFNLVIVLIVHRKRLQRGSADLVRDRNDSHVIHAVLHFRNFIVAREIRVLCIRRIVLALQCILLAVIYERLTGEIVGLGAVIFKRYIASRNTVYNHRFNIFQVVRRVILHADRCLAKTSVIGTDLHKIIQRVFLHVAVAISVAVARLRVLLVLLVLTFPVLILLRVVRTRFLILRVFTLIVRIRCRIFHRLKIIVLFSHRICCRLVLFRCSLCLGCPDKVIAEVGGLPTRDQQTQYHKDCAYAFCVLFCPLHTTLADSSAPRYTFPQLSRCFLNLFTQTVPLHRTTLRFYRFKVILSIRKTPKNGFSGYIIRYLI